MTVPAHLQRKLQETLGSDAAKDLVKLLERMDPMRGDMSELRSEVGNLRREMELGFGRIDARFERVDGRFRELDASLTGRFDTAMERGLRKQTQFFFLAWAVILASIVGLYARVR